MESNQMETEAETCPGYIYTYIFLQYHNTGESNG